MAVSLEAYLLTNFCMNIILIAIIARSQGAVNWRGVVYAAAFGTIYACAMYHPAFTLLKALPMQLLLTCTMAAVAFKMEHIKDPFVGGVKLFLGLAFLGGTQQLIIRLFRTRTMLTMSLGAALGSIALLLALETRTRKLEQWKVQLHIRTAWGCTNIHALIDTGNRLHEPFSGLPVIIVEERKLLPVLPDGFSSDEAMDRLPPGFRMVSYGALGGAGRMACFRPEELLASYGDGWMRAPDIWVAVYPGRMPGNETALAPAVIGRIQPANKRKYFINNIGMERGMRR